MITDLDETIRQILRDELPIKNGEIDIKFEQPKREWSARLSKPTINFYLYDVRENHILRQHQWEKIKAKNGRANVALLKRTPFRIDCYYMMTVWAAEPEDEHRLLSRSMLVLLRHPLLPVERLVGSLKDQPYDIQARLAQHDKLTNPAELWSALDNEIRPSVSYLLTVAMDPWTEVSGPIVRSFTMKAGQAHDLPRQQEIEPADTANEMNYIGGLVRGKEKGKPPVAGVDVAIKGTGYVARTDADGRYRLGAMPSGDYTLVVWPPKGKPIERQIHVPVDADQDYNFEV